MEPRAQRFARLVAPHHQAGLAFARRLSGSRAEGDDVYQTALVRAYDKLDQVRDEAAFKRWLFRVIANVHRNQTRVSFWRRLVPLVAEPVAVADAVDEAHAGAERARLALAALPPEQRIAIVLFEIEGWTVDEIAAAERVSESAVKSRLARGRDRLRTVYLRDHGLAGTAPRALPGAAP